MTFYSIWTYVICFITSASSGLGAGGGGILTLFMSVFSGVSQSAAQGVNLVDFIFALAPSAVVNGMRYKLNMHLITFLTFCGTTGCILGSLMSSYTPDILLRKCCGVFLAAVGTVTLINAAKDR